MRPDNPFGRLPALDGLRGLAALSVFFWHTLDVYDPGAIGTMVPGTPPGREDLIASMARRVPIGWAFNGVFAVAIFFALSGFVLTLALLSPRARGRAHEMIAQRLLRLLPVVLLGSVLGYAVVANRWVHLDKVDRPDGITINHVYDPKLVNEPGVGQLLSQVFLKVWKGAPPDQLYDRVLWTIGTEFKASVLILALVALFRPAGNRLLSYVVIAGFGVFLTDSYFLLFAAGAYLAEVYSRDDFPAFARSPFLLLVLLISSLCVGGVHPNFDGALWIWFVPKGGGPAWLLGAARALRVVLYVYASCGLIVAALFLEPFKVFLTTRPVGLLGHVSYAFYAVHQPLIISAGVLVQVYCYQFMGFGPSVVLSTAAMLAVSLLMALVATDHVDLPVNALSKRLIRRYLGGEAPAPEAPTGRGAADALDREPAVTAP